MTYNNIIADFEREHKIKNIILLGVDGAISNIEVEDIEYDS